MARGQAGAASGQLNRTNQLGSQANERANSLYSSLEPQLQSRATAPPGFGTQELSQMRTGIGQSAGGSVSGITGQANLEAARTRNSGGYATALDQGAREAAQTQSQNELNVDMANAKLKQQQQQEALSALGGLYGTGVGETESMYGLGPSTLQARAAGGGWAQGFHDVLSGIGSLGQLKKS